MGEIYSQAKLHRNIFISASLAVFIFSLAALLFLIPSGAYFNELKAQIFLANGEKVLSIGACETSVRERV